MIRSVLRRSTHFLLTAVFFITIIAGPAHATDNCVRSVSTGSSSMVSSSPFFDSTTYPWRAPGEDDERSPCVFMNTLANHGLLNHNGTFIDLFDIVTKMEQVFSFSPEFIYLTKILPAIDCGQTYEDITGTLRLDLQGLFAPRCKDFRSILVRSPKNLAAVNQTLLDNLLAMDDTKGLETSSANMLENNSSVLSLDEIALFYYNRIFEVYETSFNDPTFTIAGSDFITVETLSFGLIGTKPESAIVEKDRLREFLRWERLPNELVQTHHNFFDLHDPFYILFLDMYLMFESAMNSTFHANKNDHIDEKNHSDDTENDDKNKSNDGSEISPGNFRPPTEDIWDEVYTYFDDYGLGFDDNLHLDDAWFFFDDSVQLDDAWFFFDDSVPFDDAWYFFDDSLQLDDAVFFFDDFSDGTFPISDDDREFVDDFTPFVDDEITFDDTTETNDDIEFLVDDSVSSIDDGMLLDDHFTFDDGFIDGDDDSHHGASFFPSLAMSDSPSGLPPIESAVPSQDTMSSQTEDPVPSNMSGSAFPVGTGITDIPFVSSVPIDTNGPTMATSVETSVSSSKPTTNAFENMPSTFFPTVFVPSDTPVAEVSTNTPTPPESITTRHFTDPPTENTMPTTTLTSLSIEPSITVSHTRTPTSSVLPTVTDIVSKFFSFEPSTDAAVTPVPTDTTLVGNSNKPSAEASTDTPTPTESISIHHSIDPPTENTVPTATLKSLSPEPSLTASHTRTPTSSALPTVTDIVSQNISFEPSTNAAVTLVPTDTTLVGISDMPSTAISGTPAPTVTTSIEIPVSSDNPTAADTNVVRLSFEPSTVFSYAEDHSSYNPTETKISEEPSSSTSVFRSRTHAPTDVSSFTLTYKKSNTPAPTEIASEDVSVGPPPTISYIESGTPTQKDTSSEDIYDELSATTSSTESEISLPTDTTFTKPTSALPRDNFISDVPTENKFDPASTDTDTGTPL